MIKENEIKEDDSWANITHVLTQIKLAENRIFYLKTAIDGWAKLIAWILFLILGLGIITLWHFW
jgi:hypothetical protein